MVRQASCDVSDRNDKGSPDTVWQILGSCRGSFSCSKTSAAQTQDPALASRKQTLQSEQGAFAKFPKGAFSACLLGPMLLSMGQRGSRASGQLDLTATGTSGLHPQNLLSLLQQRSVGPEAWPPSSQGDLLFPFAHQTRQRAVTWSPECSW